MSYDYTSTNFGVVTYAGVTYKLVQDAYVTNHPAGGICYEAKAEGPDGETYMVRWLTTVDWEAREPEYQEDASEACDWASPIHVWRIS